MAMDVCVCIKNLQCVVHLVGVDKYRDSWGGGHTNLTKLQPCPQARSQLFNVAG